MPYRLEGLLSVELGLEISQVLLGDESGRLLQGLGGRVSELRLLAVEKVQRSVNQSLTLTERVLGHGGFLLALFDQFQLDRVTVEADDGGLLFGGFRCPDRSLDGVAVEAKNGFDVRVGRKDVLAGFEGCLDGLARNFTD